jgi:hypothetical protein
LSDASVNFLSEESDPRDPNPWAALYLDRSVPIADQVKRAWLADSNRWSRQWLLPFLRPTARAMIVLIQIVKLALPRSWSASRTLHRLLAWGLKTWVAPEANWLILRHFHLGSQVLNFVSVNSQVVVETSPLTPHTIDDLRDDLFLKHDLNLFNFVIRLNKALRAADKELTFVAQPDFRGLESPPLLLADMPRRWTNFIDLQTAIEVFTPIYQLFLTDNDFWRACNSLQLDETIGVYCARILGSPDNLLLLNNKHPLVPESTLRAGFRLVLHGLSTEMLHALLLSRAASMKAVPIQVA